MAELDALNESTPEPLRREWWPSEHEVGASLVAIAAGKFNWSASDIERDEPRQLRRRAAAQRVVVALFLRADASFYEQLALRCDAGSDQIREAYRRMIALVHPDSSPTGFPPDAATRVNLAYATLIDPTRRAAYDAARESTGTTAAGSRGASVARQATSARTIATPRYRFRASRRALLWIGGFLTSASAVLAYVAMPGARDIELVEARPKLKFAEASVASATTASTPTSEGAPLAPLPDSGTAADDSQSTPAAGIAAATESKVASLLSMQLSAESRRRLGTGEKLASGTDRKQQPDDRPVRTAERAGAKQAAEMESRTAATTAGSRQTVVAAASVGIDVSTAPVPPDSPPQRMAEGTGARTPQSETVGKAEGAGRNAPVSTLVRNPPIDPDEVLLRLVAAYEVGSVSAIGHLFSPQMQERHKLLAGYEKVFRDTTARSLRLGQLRHQRMDGRIRSSGPATVVTTSRDNQSSEVRVFLEIDIVRDKDQVLIERIASYAAQ